MSKNKVKTRGKSHDFTPVGEKLPSHRPATYGEILKLRNHYLNINPEGEIRAIIANNILPDILSIWKKIHPALVLCDEKSMLLSLYNFFTSVDSMYKDKKSSSKRKKQALETKMKQVFFNCSTCKCGLPEMVCRYTI